MSRPQGARVYLDGQALLQNFIWHGRCMHTGYVDRIRSASVTYGTDGKRMVNNIGLYVGTVKVDPGVHATRFLDCLTLPFNSPIDSL